MHSTSTLTDDQAIQFIERAIAERWDSLAIGMLGSHQIDALVAEGWPSHTIAAVYDGVGSARQRLVHATNLTRLNLSHNNYRSWGADDGPPNLSMLLLNNNKIGVKGARAIAARHRGLKRLSLRHTVLGPDAPFVIAAGIPDLEQLDLGANYDLGSAGAVAIARSFPSLTSLQLDETETTDEGAIALVRGLPKLSTLGLAGNRLTDHTAQEVANHLPDLTSLDLRDNPITTTGAITLVTQLPNLTHLYLDGELDTFDGRRVLDAIASGPLAACLKVLQLPHISGVPTDVVKRGRAQEIIAAIRPHG